MSKVFIESAVVNVLLTHGWRATLGPAAAMKSFTKTFQTAVGDKAAFAYLSSGERHWVLQGDYQSEGRNCLEPHGVLIPKGVAEAEVHRLTGYFADQADTAVHGTYAARLAANQQ